MPKLSRRQLGLVALSPLAQSQAQQSAAYKGALDNHSVNAATFDPVAWTLERYQSAPLQLTYKESNRSQTEAWQKKLRAKVTELLGGFPQTRHPLSPQILETKEFPGYVREKFILETRPNLGLLGYILTPKNNQSKHPVAICLPGHGRGVDDIVGIDDKGRPRTDKAGYQHDFALQCVEQGMAAVAIEQLAFGCRRDARTAKGGLGRSACQPTAGAALLLGETMIGWRVYDVMRTVDFIATRPNLDSSRIGLTGISGGGTITVFGAALEPRIRAAFASGYLCTFRDSVFSLSHCIDNYVPGILRYAEMYDVAGLIAPRPFFAESGTRDDIFPVGAAKDSFARVQRVYKAFNATDRTGHQTFEGEHSWHGVEGVPFLAKHLS